MLDTQYILVVLVERYSAATPVSKLMAKLYRSF